MPAAEKSASHAACAATSASEWPSSPRSPGQSSPATHSSRPDPGGGEGVHVDPDADPGQCAHGVSLAARRARPRHAAASTRSACSRSSAVVTLNASGVAVDDDHVVAAQLDERGVVGGLERHRQ